MIRGTLVVMCVASCGGLVDGSVDVAEGGITVAADAAGDAGAVAALVEAGGEAATPGDAWTTDAGPDPRADAGAGEDARGDEAATGAADASIGDAPTESASDAGLADAADGAGPSDDGGVGTPCGAVSGYAPGPPCKATACPAGLTCYMTSCGPIGVAGGACLPANLTYYFVDPTCSGASPPCVDGYLPWDGGPPETPVGSWCLPAIPGQGPTGCGL